MLQCVADVAMRGECCNVFLFIHGNTLCIVFFISCAVNKKREICSHLTFFVSYAIYIRFAKFRVPLKMYNIIEVIKL